MAARPRQDLPDDQRRRDLDDGHDRAVRLPDQPDQQQSGNRHRHRLRLPELQNMAVTRAESAIRRLDEPPVGLRSVVSTGSAYHPYPPIGAALGSMPIKGAGDTDLGILRELAADDDRRLHRGSLGRLGVASARVRAGGRGILCS